jgi:WD40 repeat protein
VPYLTEESPTDDLLDDLINGYLEARQEGRDPDRTAMLDAHPELAGELERFFAAHDAMDRLAGPLRAVARAARVVGDEDSGAGGDQRPPIPVEFGAYVLLEVLGAGGMGIVYRAHHRSLNRAVALKQILLGLPPHSAVVQRFRNEAEAAARLDHPNIVPVYDVGEYQGRHYLTMRLIEGGSLAEHRDELRADPRAAARLMTAVAGAVHHAHQRGILHRDLKPSNILLDRQGQPHVTDFGLARQIGVDSTLTGSGAVLGSPPYMAPEQAAGRTEAITTATDVYGLGAVLYVLLTGRPPFRGDSVLATLEQVRSCAPERPSRVNPRVDRDLETICLKCLEKETDQRYASAAALAEDLQRWLEGQPIQGRRTGTMHRAALWVRRRPYVAALSAGLVVLFSLGLGSVFWEWRAAVAARRDMEVALYESRIALADRELSAGEPSHAQELLDDSPPSLRGWEWYHLRDRRRCDVAWFDDPLEAVSVAYRPDGGLLATGLGLKTILIWDPGAAGLKERHRWDAHALGVMSLSFSRDGRRLVSASFDGTAKVWDTTTWKVLAVLEGKPLGGLWCAAIHPDDRRIALAGFQKTVGLWEPETGHLRVFPGHGDRVTAVAFHPAGRVLASASDDATVRLWDLETGREIARHRDPGLFSFSCVAFSPDGLLLAGGSGGGALTLWETATGREVFRRVHQSAFIRRLAFSPDGRRIATTGGPDRAVVIWDAATGRDLLSLHGHPGEVWDVAFRGDGQALASVGGRMVRVWHAPRREPTATAGRLILRGHEERVEAVAFGADSRRLATASWDRTVRIWDPATGQLIQTWHGPAGALKCVAIAPDGRVAASGRDRIVTIWDRTGRVIQTLTGHERNVWALAFNPDGRLLASGGEDGVVNLWDAQSPGRTPELRRKFDSFVYSLAFRPDDAQLAIALGKGMIVLQDIRAGRGDVTLGSSAPLRVNSLAYRPDGRALAAGTQNHGVQVWDPATGRHIRELNDQEGEVRAVAYSPDGRSLAAGGADRTVRIWDVATGSARPLFRDGAGQILSLAFSPDGRYLAATNGDKTASVWDLIHNPLTPSDRAQP